MSNASALVSKYKRHKTRINHKPKFNPNKKWVEYSLDLLEAKGLIQNADFNTKMDLLNVIKTIESKINYHQKHRDFVLEIAIKDFRLARRLLRM